jgi:uracil permease
MAMIIAFISPFVAFLDSIPGCVMGGVCITLYGFIAVSGLKMIQKVDLEQHANLFTVSAILIPGIGGMAMAIGKVTITAIAASLILGIIINVILHKKEAK